jgi:uncharacterized integral membrane protein (TIGR00697 family)
LIKREEWFGFRGRKGICVGTSRQPNGENESRDGFEWRYDIVTPMDMQVAENPAQKTRNAQVLLLVFTGILITCYLSANIMAVKLISVGGFTLTDAGTITFPITYFIGDLMTEIWGFKTSRKVIFLTFFCNILMIASTTLPIFLPSPDYMADIDKSYEMIFTYVPRIIFASLIAFLIGELANAFLMEKIRIWTGKRFLWMRTIGSSVVGYLLDTVIFTTIAFAGTAPLGDILSMIFSTYGIKMLIEVACGTPIAYAVIWIMRKGFGVTRESIHGQ